MVNVLFWFIVKANPDADSGGDSIKTIVTRYDVPHFNDRSHIQMRHSMAAVITTTMTLRIILSVRGPLHYGGSFAGVWSSSTATHSASRGIGIASARAPANATSILQITSHTHTAPTYTLDRMGQKSEHAWDGSEGKNDILSENDHKAFGSPDSEFDSGLTKAPGLHGVKITVDREIADFDPSRMK